MMTTPSSCVTRAHAKPQCRGGWLPGCRCRCCCVGWITCRVHRVLRLFARHVPRIWVNDARTHGLQNVMFASEYMFLCIRMLSVGGECVCLRILFVPSMQAELRVATVSGSSATSLRHLHVSQHARSQQLHAYVSFRRCRHCGRACTTRYDGLSEYAKCLPMWRPPPSNFLECIINV